MNVVQLINGLGRGGGEHMLVDLASRRAEGERFSVFTLTRQGVLADALRRLGVPVRGLAWRGVPLPWRYAVLLGELGEADVLHTHFFYSDLVGGLMARLAGNLRVVASRHETGYWMRPWQRALERLAYARHDAVVCVSAAVRDALAARGVAPNKLEVVHPVVADASPVLVAAPERAVILAVGRLERVKGHDVLIDAVAQLWGDGRLGDAELVIVGDGTERESLARRARGLPCRFLGELGGDEVRVWMARARLVVQPSRSEGLPLVLLEAMQAGRAVVASRVGGVGELVRHGENGWLVPAENTVALADAIARLLGDEELSSRLGGAAKADVGRDFSPAAHAARLRHLYGVTCGVPSSSYDVCMLVRNDFTIDSRVERVAESLSRRGARVRVLAEGREGLSAQETKEGYDVARLTRRRPGSRLRGLMETARYYASSVRQVVKSRPAVVHCNDLDTLLPGALAAAWLGSELVYDAHELWVERHSGLRGVRRRIDRLKYGAMERALIGRAKVVFTVSEGIADELGRRYRIARPRLLRNIPARQAAASHSLRQRVGGEGPIVLFLGRIDPERGLEEAVEALPEIPLARLVMLGTAVPKLLAKLEARARELGARERLVHLPAVPRTEVLAWAREADVGLCLNKPVCLNHELSLPNKFFEYACAGVPIVASDLTEMRSYVERYRLGAVCDPTSPRDIARAVNDVLARRVPLAEPGAFARELDWERESAQLAAAYPWLWQS